MICRQILLVFFPAHIGTINNKHCTLSNSCNNSQQGMIRSASTVFDEPSVQKAMHWNNCGLPICIPLRRSLLDTLDRTSVVPNDMLNEANTHR